MSETPDSPTLPGLSRRSFLRWAALSGVGLTMGWRFVLPAGGESYEGLRSISQADARLLAAVYATVTGAQESAELRDAVAFMDEFIARISARDRLELRAGLRLLEHSPIFFHGFLPRFTKLDGERRARVLEGWRDGAHWRRPLFGALKDLSYLAYYRSEATWKAIGYSGPYVPVTRPPGPRDLEYQTLLARGEGGT